METRAYLKGTRLSPQKAALVADQIRGKSVDEAMDFLLNSISAFSKIK
jgi:large subunit ribosomal protein L22